MEGSKELTREQASCLWQKNADIFTEIADTHLASKASAAIDGAHLWWSTSPTTVVSALVIYAIVFLVHRFVCRLTWKLDAQLSERSKVSQFSWKLDAQLSERSKVGTAQLHPMANQRKDADDGKDGSSSALEQWRKKTADAERRQSELTQALARKQQNDTSSLSSSPCSARTQQELAGDDAKSEPTSPKHDLQCACELHELHAKLQNMVKELKEQAEPERRSATQETAELLSQIASVKSTVDAFRELAWKRLRTNEQQKSEMLNSRTGFARSASLSLTTIQEEEPDPSPSS